MSNSSDMYDQPGGGELVRATRSLRVLRSGQAGQAVSRRQSQSGEGQALARVLPAVQRNRRLATVVFCAVFVPFLLWISTSPITYQAEARLLFKREPFGLGGPASPADQASATVSEAEVGSEIELLRGGELMEKVVAQQGLADPSEPGSPRQQVARAVQHLQDRLEIERIPRTTVISLRYADEDPAQAADVLNSLVAFYLEKRAALERHPEALKFLTEHLELYAQELTQAQAELSVFKQRHEISLLESQKEANRQRMAAIEVALQEMSAGVVSAERRVELLRRQGTQQPRTVTTSSRSAVNAELLEGLKSRLADLENQRTELLSGSHRDPDLLRELETKIADTRRALERERSASVVDQTEAPNPRRQAIEAEYFRTQAEIRGQRARQRDLLSELQEKRARQRELEAVTAEYDSLLRRVQIAQDNYELYQSRKKDARLADASEMRRVVQVSILEPAKPPPFPEDQHRPVMAMFSLLLAGCAAVGGALIGDRHTRPVGSAGEIAALTGLPVLTTSVEPQRLDAPEAL